jgi:hypothetical protein
MEVHRNEDGEIQLKNTGDPYVDKWEAEIASGLAPNMTEAFTADEMDWFKRTRLRSVDRVRYQQAVQEFEERRAPKKEAPPRYNSPFMTFGDDD